MSLDLTNHDDDIHVGDIEVGQELRGSIVTAVKVDIKEDDDRLHVKKLITLLNGMAFQSLRIVTKEEMLNDVKIDPPGEIKLSPAEIKRLKEEEKKKKDLDPARIAARAKAKELLAKRSGNTPKPSDDEQEEEPEAEQAEELNDSVDNIDLKEMMNDDGNDDETVVSTLQSLLPTKDAANGSRSSFLSPPTSRRNKVGGSLDAFLEPDDTASTPSKHKKKKRSKSKGSERRSRSRGGGGGSGDSVASGDWDGNDSGSVGSKSASKRKKKKKDKNGETPRRKKKKDKSISNFTSSTEDEYSMDGSVDVLSLADLPLVSGEEEEEADLIDHSAEPKMGTDEDDSGKEDMKERKKKKGKKDDKKKKKKHASPGKPKSKKRFSASSISSEDVSLGSDVDSSVDDKPLVDEDEARPESPIPDGPPITVQIKLVDYVQRDANGEVHEVGERILTKEIHADIRKVDVLCDYITEQTGIPKEYQKLFVRNKLKREKVKQLTNTDKFLIDYGLQDMDMIELAPITITLNYKQINQLDTLVTIKDTFYPTTTIDTIKNHIAEGKCQPDIPSIPATNLSLRHMDVELRRANNTIHHELIKHGDILDIEKTKITINVKLPPNRSGRAGRIIPIGINPKEDDIDTIKDLISDRTGVPKNFLPKFADFDGMKLEDDGKSSKKKKLVDYDIAEDDTLEMEPMTIYVNNLHNFDDPICITDVDPFNDTVDDIKEHIAELGVLPTDRQRLFFKENDLDDEGDGDKSDNGNAKTDDDSDDDDDLGEIGEGSVRLTVAMPDGKTLRLKCEPDDTVLLVKSMIHVKTGIPPTEQVLAHDGSGLMDDRFTFEDCGIEGGDELELEGNPNGEGDVILNMVTPDGKSAYINCQPNSTLSEVKDKIASKTGISPFEQAIKYKGFFLDDDDEEEPTMEDYGIKNGEQLVLEKTTRGRKLFECGVANLDTIDLEKSKINLQIKQPNQDILWLDGVDPRKDRLEVIKAFLSKNYYHGKDKDGTIPEDQLRPMLHDGKLMEGSKPIRQYGLMDDEQMVELKPMMVNIIQPFGGDDDDEEGGPLEKAVDPMNDMVQDVKLPFAGSISTDKLIIRHHEGHMKEIVDDPAVDQSYYGNGIHEGHTLELQSRPLAIQIKLPPGSKVKAKEDVNKNDHRVEVHDDEDGNPALTLKLQLSDELNTIKQYIMDYVGVPVDSQRLNKLLATDDDDDDDDDDDEDDDDESKRRSKGRVKLDVPGDTQLCEPGINIVEDCTIELEPMTINVRDEQGTLVPLTVAPFETIEDIKKRLEEKTGIPYNQQRLSNQDEIEIGGDGTESLGTNESTVADVGLHDGDVLFVEKSKIALNVEMPYGMDAVEVFVDPKHDDADAIRRQVFDATGLPKEYQQRLRLGDELLDDGYDGSSDGDDEDEEYYEDEEDDDGERRKSSGRSSNKKKLGEFDGLEELSTIVLEPARIVVLKMPEEETTVLEDINPIKDTLEDIKAKIEEIHGIPSDQQLLFNSETEEEYVDDEEEDEEPVLCDYGIQDGETIMLSCKPVTIQIQLPKGSSVKSKEDVNDDDFRLEIMADFDGNPALYLTLNPDMDDLATIQQYILDYVGVPIDSQRLNRLLEPKKKKDGKKQPLNVPSDTKLSSPSLNMVSDCVIELEPMTIHINTGEGETIPLPVLPTDTVEDIKKKLAADYISTPYDQQHLTLEDGREIGCAGDDDGAGNDDHDNEDNVMRSNQSTLLDLGIVDGDTLNLSKSQISLKIKMPNEMDDIDVVVDPTKDDVETIRQYIFDATGLPKEYQQRITFCDESLDGGYETLGEDDDDEGETDGANDKTRPKRKLVEFGILLDTTEIVLEPTLIFIMRIPELEQITLEVDPMKHILQDVKKMIAKETSLQTFKQRLLDPKTNKEYFGNKFSAETLQDLNIKHGDIINLEKARVNLRLILPHLDELDLEVDPRKDDLKKVREHLFKRYYDRRQVPDRDKRPMMIRTQILTKVPDETKLIDLGIRKDDDCIKLKPCSLTLDTPKKVIYCPNADPFHDDLETLRLLVRSDNIAVDEMDIEYDGKIMNDYHTKLYDLNIRDESTVYFVNKE